MWHWGENSSEGSEHYLNGVQQPMEVQLFHWNTKYSDYVTASQNSDGLAAVSFFYEVATTDNPVLAKQIEVLGYLAESTPLYHGQDLDHAKYPFFFHPEFEEPFSIRDLSQLLPSGGIDVSDNYFHYTGSQTLPRAPVSRGFFDWGSPPFNTPGGTGTKYATDPPQTDCTESVTWIVYERKIAISEAQLGAYRGLLSTVNSKGIDATTITTQTWWNRGALQFTGTNWFGYPCCDCQADPSLTATCSSSSTYTWSCCETFMCTQNFRPPHPLNPSGTARKSIPFVFF